MKVSLFARAAQLLIVLTAIGLAATIQAQTPTPSPQTSPLASPAQSPAATTPPANPADVATMDSIIAAVYDVISGPAKAERNWDRFRSLFIPGARLIPTGRRQTGEVLSRVLTPEEYIQRSGPSLQQNGFFEREISKRVEKFGNIAHVFSTYDSKRAKEDEKPFARGINSFQLMNDGKRWWIVTIFWQAEDDKNPLPAEYLRTRN